MELRPGKLQTKGPAETRKKMCKKDTTAGGGRRAEIEVPWLLVDGWVMPSCGSPV